RSTGFLQEMMDWVTRITPASMANSLTQTLLRLTSPGVPDLYQGTEFLDLSLVDPDNRRPVDYDIRRRSLEQHELSCVHIGEYQEGQHCQLKQALIYAVLQLRKRDPALFSNGEYVPLSVSGPLEEHVIAFLRRYQDRHILVVALRTSLALLNDHLCLRYDSKEAAAQTIITLPPQVSKGNYIDVLTHQRLDTSSMQLQLGTLLHACPVALLCAEA